MRALIPLPDTNLSSKSSGIKHRSRVQYSPLLLCKPGHTGVISLFAAVPLKTVSCYSPDAMIAIDEVVTSTGGHSSYASGKPPASLAPDQRSGPFDLVRSV